MSKHLTANAAKIAILQQDLKDLQSQLETAHKRILELAKDKNSTQEELKQQKQLLLELEGRYSKQHFETTQKIEKQIKDWPDVVDSRPEKKFKYKDIQPGEWD